MDLLGELVGLVAESLGTLGDLARDNLEVVLKGNLELLNGGGSAGALDLVATGLDDLGEVAAATTVPGKQVGGVRVGEIAEGVLGGDADEVLLQLSGGDGSGGIVGVNGGLEREVVGKETSNVGRGHGSAGDGVDGVLGADPGGLDAQTGGEDVSALAVVGKVGTAVIESRGTDGQGLASGSRRVLASIGVVVASGNGEVNTRADSGVDGGVESLGLATTKRHVGDGALEALALAVLGSLDLLKVLGGSVLNTLDDVGHGAGAVGAEDLDGVDVGLLGHTVLLTGDGTRAVSAVAVTVDILVAAGDGLTPLGTALEVDVLGVDTSVNDIGVNTLTALGSVQVLVEGTEVEGVTVRDTGKTPGGLLLGLAVALVLSYLGLDIDGKHGVDKDITLDVLNLTGTVSRWLR